MMLRKILPYSAYKRLFGDRKKYGLTINERDNDWIVFHQSTSLWDFYQTTQLCGIGDMVSRMAYPVVGLIDFGEKQVLEVGPGIIRHLQYFKSNPVKYTICDINEDVLSISGKQLEAAGIPYDTFLIARESGSGLPFADESFDIVISFNSLEHLHPLDSYLNEIERILKRGGQLVGGIPCEGGLAWGLGRFLTTRRYVHKNYKINYDKIICWEHPNYADFIIERLHAQFERVCFNLHPFPCLPIDFNLVGTFVYRKRSKRKGKKWQNEE